jgi:pimeloyl-ACP methyl ester carboxylesterase
VSLVAPAQQPQETLAVAPLDSFPAAWGRAFEARMHSKSLDQERRFRVFVPASFDTTLRRYPVIFITDGDSYFEPASIVARQLARSGHIPECLVVAVSTVERVEDMTPPGMGIYPGKAENADRFLSFLAEEIAPQLVERWRAATPTVLVGHSQGGILCHHAAAKWRAQFPFLIALDTPVNLQDYWLAKRLDASLAAGGHLRLASIEAVYGWRDGAWRTLEQNAPKDWRLARVKLANEDHNSMLFEGLFAGLKAVFSDYSAACMRQFPPREAFAHYEGLSRFYGAPPTPPLQLLRRAMEELLIRGEREAALRALAAMREGYSQPADPADAERRIDEAAKAMQGEPTVDELLRAPRPTAAEMQPWLGVWKGPCGFEGHRFPNTVTFGLRDGRGDGTVVIEETSEQSQTLKLDYLRVTAGGIEFGFMNGMHPRGMLTHVGRLEKGRLVGKIVLMGVHFEPPPGEVPPTYEFELERVGTTDK